MKMPIRDHMHANSICKNCSQVFILLNYPIVTSESNRQPIREFHLIFH